MREIGPRSIRLAVVKPASCGHALEFAGLHDP
jgi:hypothetical protein